MVCPWQWHWESWAQPQSTNVGAGVVTRGARDIVIPPAGISTAGGYESGCVRRPGDRKCSCTCQQMALTSAAATMAQPFMWITQPFQMVSFLKRELPLSLRKLSSLQGWLYKSRGTVLAGCLPSHDGCSIWTLGDKQPLCLHPCRGRASLSPCPRDVAPDKTLLPELLPFKNKT